MNTAIAPNTKEMLDAIVPREKPCPLSVRAEICLEKRPPKTKRRMPGI
jgi:hypothetical protein